MREDGARREFRARVYEAGIAVDAVLLQLVMVLGVVFVRVDGAIFVAVNMGRVHGMGQRESAGRAMHP